jgi:hypothetical protein
MRLRLRAMPLCSLRYACSRSSVFGDHLGTLASMDFFVVLAVTFRLLYVVVILSHSHRRNVYFHVTMTPTAAWGSRQLHEVFPFEMAPSYLAGHLCKLLYELGLMP